MNPDREHMVRKKCTRFWGPGSVFLIRDRGGSRDLRRWSVQKTLHQKDGLWDVHLMKMTLDEEIVYEVLSS